MSPPLVPLSLAEIDQLSNNLVATNASLRIFAYGSIIWAPNFAFVSRKVGWVPGFKRRFYQGSTQHRGTQQNPGRVATLVASARPASAQAWGVAFEIRGAAEIRAALGHLTERETHLGGYRLYRVAFASHQQQQPATSACEISVQEAYAYIADASNPLYLGKASLIEQARRVATAVGPAGPNADYVRRVAEFMLREVPDGPAHDSHVFELLRLVDSYSTPSFELTLSLSTDSLLSETSSASSSDEELSDGDAPHHGLRNRESATAAVMAKALFAVAAF